MSAAVRRGGSWHDASWASLPAARGWWQPLPSWWEPLELLPYHLWISVLVSALHRAGTWAAASVPRKCYGVPTYTSLAPLVPCIRVLLCKVGRR